MERIPRKAQVDVLKYMQVFPAVAILGSRQCGKSTLVQMMAEKWPNFMYVDLQSYQQRMQLTDPALFFEHNAERTICLDEVQLMPELFGYLRGEIDRDRRKGRFLLLGSASRELMQHTTESLAGRIGMIDLSPFLVEEICGRDDYNQNKYWLRGGYPDSYLAEDDEASSIWRENFIRTYIERDIPQMGFAIAAPKMMRLLMMLCHEHGGILNVSKLASAMDLSAPTIRHYIDILEASYIVRTLPPYFKNIRKRLVKTPRIYLRDSGLLHQVLGIRGFNDLLGHPVVGFSWEGMVVENVCASVKEASFYFYRSSDGSEEMDLVIETPRERIAIECKSNGEPQLTKGFWRAIDTLEADRAYVVCPIKGSYPLSDKVTVISLTELMSVLS